MNYSSESIKKAYDELDKRRSTAIAVQSARVREIREKYPEAYSVYMEIVSTKDRLAEVILSKSGDIRSAVEKIRDGNLKAQDRLGKLLRGYGLPEDYLNIHYFCQKCRDSGVREGNRCECVSELLDKYSVEELNRLCSIKLSDFADFDITYYPESITYAGKNYNPRQIMEDNLRFCIDYAKNFSEHSPSVFMLGETGLGKTFLSGCIAKEVRKKGFSAAFDSAQSFFREIEKEHFGRSDGDTLGTLMNADLVIIDDLGSELHSPFNASAAYNVINSRLNLSKPTIISSNLSLEELAKFYDDRIMSRLMGMFRTLRFIGTDIRQIKRRMGVYE